MSADSATGSARSTGIRLFDQRAPAPGRPYRPRPVDAVPLPSATRYLRICHAMRRPHRSHGMMATQLATLGGTLKTRAILPAVSLLAAAAVLTACDSGTSKDSADKPGKAPATAAATPSAARSAAEKAVGLPPEPTGATRAVLLRALEVANPDTVRYEDKAIDAARNQCMAITGGGRRLDRAASQRFTYKDVTTTEAQGKQINEALKGLGFCTS
ncbi:hypothetical protein [Streptomyces sp. NPDC059466]|uniref:hypothetical protein n=1 Tax=unclassified Streptomyces TaxID=2593676 RepID=UPI0036CB1A28